MFRFIIFLTLLLFFSGANAADSLLTIKQQLDRLQREVNDLTKTVYTSTRDGNLEVTNEKIQTSDLSAFDLRIYDLEKDIKKLNSSFEELVFQIDDLKGLYEKLDTDISNLLINFEKHSLEREAEKNQVESKNIETGQIQESQEKNTLGTLVINSEDLSDNNENLMENNQNEDLKLTPEEEFQMAFDMLRNQQFDEAKKALQKFINEYKEDSLAGTAHYWLGELFILKKEYRESALILAEGYQKFPKSVKAPDMLYKLSESLVFLNKINDSCNTLSKIKNEFSDHKIINKVNNKITVLQCSDISE